MSIRVNAAFEAYYASKVRRAVARAAATQGLQTVKPGSSNGRNRRRHLRHLQDILTREGVTHIGMMEQRHVDTAFDEIVASITPKIGVDPSPNTITTVVVSLGNFIRWQIDHGNIPAGKKGLLLENLPSLETFERKMLVIPGKDWPEIFRIAHRRHWTDRILLELAYYLAMRVSEATSVRWQDLDLDEDEVTFFRQKRQDQLKLPIPTELRASLMEYRQWLTDQGTPPQPSWPIVLTRVESKKGRAHGVKPDWSVKPGARMSAGTASQGLHAALDGFGIKPEQMVYQGMHITRRSRACMLVRNGVDIRIVAKILGHRNWQTTLTYIRDGLDDVEVARAMNIPSTPVTDLVPAEAVNVTPGQQNLPTVPQSPEGKAGALLTLLQSGLLSDAEAQVLLARIMAQ